MVKLYKSVRRCNFQRNKNVNPVLFPTKGLRPKRRIFLYRFKREPIPFAYHCIECTSYTGNVSPQPETPQTCCKLWILPACYKLATSCIKSVDFIKLKQVCENQTCCNLIFADLLQVAATCAFLAKNDIRDLKIDVYAKRLTSNTLFAIKTKSLTMKCFTYRIYSKYRKRRTETLGNLRPVSNVEFCMHRMQFKQCIMRKPI